MQFRVRFFLLLWCYWLISRIWMIGRTGNDRCFRFTIIIFMIIISWIIRWCSWLLTIDILAYRTIHTCICWWIIISIFITTTIGYIERNKKRVSSFSNRIIRITIAFSINTGCLLSTITILWIVVVRTLIWILTIRWMIGILRIGWCTWTRSTIGISCWIGLLIVLIRIPMSISRMKF